MKMDNLMFKKRFQCELGWNKVKYARITITHVSMLTSVLIFQRMTFVHVAILLSSTQRVVEYLLALKHFYYSCSLGYKQPITSKMMTSPRRINFTRDLKHHDLILSFLVLSRTNIGSKTFCSHYGRY